jgi:hypothetical protein
VRAYVATTGVVFGLLVLAHIWRIVVEGRALGRDPYFLGITAIAAALSLWAANVLRRMPRNGGT